MRAHLVESILAPLFKMLEATFELFVPIIVAEMIDTGVAGRDVSFLVKRLLLLLVLAACGLAFSITAQYFSAKVATDTAETMRNDLFRHMETLSWHQIDSLGTSTLITRMTSDINTVQNGVNMFLRLFLRSPFVVFGAMFMAFTVDSHTAMASARRVDDVFRITNDMEDGSQPFPPAAAGVSVDFHDVVFRYEKDAEPALTDITFHADAGSTIGIIGGTGSGKSSIVNLIPRFYDTESGSVILNGRDVWQIRTDDLRSHIGLVPQKAVLFHGTLRDNMKWGREDATDEEINEAIDIAQAREFVDSKGEGLDLMIEQEGRNLSGGQKQRLTIARAVVRKPDILILDDSASALDFATDAALRHAIRTRAGNSTVILVSQRVSTVRSADEILVMNDGKLAGCGTHRELLNSCPEYQDICASQMTPEEIARDREGDD